MLKNSVHLVGLQFKYVDDTTDEFKGNNGDNNGAIEPIDIDLMPGERVVGVKLEYSALPLKIGFTIMKPTA